MIMTCFGSVDHVWWTTWMDNATNQIKL